MKIPSKEIAIELLEESGKMFPGLWVEHSYLTAQCAQKIASLCELNEDSAYVLGLLHDIGRRFGAGHLKHVYAGYTYMNELGYEDVARICLTHSFQHQDIHAYSGNIDIEQDQYQLLEEHLKSLQYDDYDRLIQLCDALAFPGGVVAIETRLMDVILRYGTNELTALKYRAIYDLKRYFESKMNINVYELFDANISVDTVIK